MISFFIKSTKKGSLKWCTNIKCPKNSNIINNSNKVNKISQRDKIFNNNRRSLKKSKRDKIKNKKNPISVFFKEDNLGTNKWKRKSRKKLGLSKE